MPEPPFVGRETQVHQLHRFLDAALAGHGQVVFLAGEAGSGKTALALEFARRAQSGNDGLVVAMGNCNAQTGLGEPYLPFREALSLLYGDVDAQLAKGAVGQENARRLRNLLIRSGQVLIELGPDLIDIVVPGSRLVAVAGKAAAQKLGWLDELEKITQRKRSEPRLERPALDQSQILEQYARVLQALAAQQPILLILDDLQWADAASINMLFHLARRTGDSPIMILGTYRPDDVAIGRDGGPHPLVQVLAELKRYNGDIVLDLAQAEQTEGRQFVDALLATEPNNLSPAFQQALYEHTEGHPLFVIELLRHLQETGNLVKDDSGCWVEGPDLDWSALPARIEGVIEARLGRLQSDERDDLSVAAVEGAGFTVQVVAAVQQKPERDMLRRFSSDLDRQHHLVGERGVERVGRHSLFLYEFRHNLFQTYLYDHLSAGERVLLHGSVGEALESLYAEHAADIAPRLARHFWEAGDDAKALVYLTASGDAAARAYANTEAIGHYTRAIEVARRLDAGSETLKTLYMARGRAFELDSHFKQAVVNYREMEDVARHLNDGTLELWARISAAVAMAIPSEAYDRDRATLELNAALALARATGDERAESKALWGLMLQARYRGDDQQSLFFGEQALVLARRLGMKEHLAYILHDLAPVYASQRDRAHGEAASDEAAQLWRELGNLPMLADGLGGRSIGAFYAGHLDRSLEMSDEAYQLSKSIGQIWGMAHSRFVVGRILLERGEAGPAIEAMNEAIRLSDLAFHPGVGFTNRHNLAWTYALMGDTQRGLDLARQLVEIRDSLYESVRSTPFVLLARIELLRGDLPAAQDAAQHFGPPQQLGTFLSAINIDRGLCDIEMAIADHDDGRAIAAAADLLAFLRAMDFRVGMSDALLLTAKALLAEQRADEAYTALGDARSVALEIGSRLTLWEIAWALSRIEAERGNDARAAQLKREARDTITYIADHAGTPELRTSFLNLPDVRAAMA